MAFREPAIDLREERRAQAAIVWRNGARRIVSVVLYVLLLIGVVALLPVLLPMAAAGDAVRRSNWGGLRTVLLLVWYLALEVAGVLAAGWLWLRGGGPFGSHGDAFLDRNFRLQCWWAHMLARGGLRILELDLEVDRPFHYTGRPFVLFLRHASFIDTLIPAYLVSCRHGVVLRYVLKRELLWDPCLDIVGNRLRNCFIARSPDSGGRDAAQVHHLGADLTPGEGAVIYPEGTRYTPEKRAHILEKLRAAGKTEQHETARRLEHVLPPRPRGALALLTACPEADAVFCAHAGLDGVLSFRSLLAGALTGRRLHVAFWTVPAREIPSGEDAQVAWLNDQWRAMDRYVGDHKTPTGH